MTFKPYQRHFIVPYGAVLKEGGSLNLAQGQIGLFSTSSYSQDGLEALSDLQGRPKDEHLVLRVGSGSQDTSRSGNDKDYSTPHFTLEDVRGISASAPDSTEQEEDAVILGYNGINPNTTIRVEKGDNITVFLHLSGGVIETLGYGPQGVTIRDYITVEQCAPINPNKALCPSADPCNCDPCMPVSSKLPVRRCIESLRSQRLRGGYTVADVIDILPVDGSNTTSVASAANTAIDTYAIEVCDTGDLAAGSLIQAQYPGASIVRVDRSGATSKYQAIFKTAPAAYVPKLGAVLKECSDTCSAGYTSTAGGALYAVSYEDSGVNAAAPIQALPNAVAGTAVKVGTDSKGFGFYTVILTKKLTPAQLKTFVTANPTAIVKYVGNLKTICKGGTLPSVAWKKIGTVYQTQKDYILDLSDDSCGNSRLAELQSFYANLTVEEEGTTGGCSRRYRTSVTTSVVGEQCDPIFQDFFTAEPPLPYDGNIWKEIIEVEDIEGECLTGILFRGKTQVLDPGEHALDNVDYRESSVRIEVSGGYADEAPNENYPVFNNPLHVHWVSRWAPRTHVAGNMRRFEKSSRAYFTGRHVHHDAFARAFLNEGTLLPDGQKQIVDYELTIRPTRYGQLAQTTHTNLSFHIITYLGYQKDVEDLLNKIAAAAGISPVKALP
jgi:hypothetical protein